MPIRIFICCAREDDSSRARLEQHLEAIGRRLPIEHRHGREVLGGLRGADLVLLLVSPDLLASSCLEGVTPRTLTEANQGSHVVVPIVVRPIPDLRATVGELAVLPDFATAVSDWVDEDAAWLKIERGLARAIEHLAKKRRLT